jgi:spore coat polysaccharide biosynthesis predicted glycosyltransferase SpsG
MSKIEHILHKAHKKGIFEETMSLAQDIKIENPKLEVEDRYELAYERAKRTRIKSFPPINN